MVGLRGKVVVAIRFKEDGIEQKRTTNKESFLIRSGIIREANFKSILLKQRYSEFQKQGFIFSIAPGAKKNMACVLCFEQDVPHR